MLDSDYVSLLESLRGSLDRPLVELDESLRVWVEKAFSPNRWDALTPSDREDLARKWDYRADPSNHAERQRAWDRGCEIVEVERQLEELNEASPTSVTEIAIKRRISGELTAQLENLTRARENSTFGRLSTRHPIHLSPDDSAGDALVFTELPNAGVPSESPGRGTRSTDYERWLRRASFDGWLKRKSPQLLNKDLEELVCCYPDGTPADVLRNRERFEDVLIDVVCEDVAIAQHDVPQPVLARFQEKYDEVARRIEEPLPDDLGERNLLIWEKSFPGVWRPDAAEDGTRLLWEGSGYSCWLDPSGAARWTAPRFLPGRDYEGAFRGIEMSTACGLNVVCAIAGFRNAKTGVMLNQALFLALRALGYGEDATANVNAEPRAESTGIATLPTVFVHLIDSRDDDLGPVIRLAQTTALEPNNHHSVWAELLKLAKKANPPTPLVGHRADESILWNDSIDKVQTFTKSALKMRFHRTKRAAERRTEALQAAGARGRVR